MKLVIGGFAQGKLGYVMNSCRPRECMVLDGSRLSGRSLDGNRLGGGLLSRSSLDGSRLGGDLLSRRTLDGDLSDGSLLDGGLLDGSLGLKEAPGEKALIVNHLHSWIRECLLRGGHPEEEVLAFAERHPDCIWISDEIGNGIVPVDAFEREYRERTGRIQVMLAERAEEVVRVICGIGQKIK